MRINNSVLKAIFLGASILILSQIVTDSFIMADELSLKSQDSSEQLYAAEASDPNILVNGTEYVSTMDEAVALLDAEYPNTIQLVDSVKGDLFVPSGMEVKLDLNGKRLTTTQISNAGSLTIFDSTSGKRGSVYTVPTKEDYLISNTGTLSILDTSLVMSRFYFKVDNNYTTKYRTTALFVKNTGTCTLQGVKEIIEAEGELLSGSSIRYNTVVIRGLQNSGTATVDGLSLTASCSVRTTSTSSLYYSSHFVENYGSLNYLSGLYDIAFDKSKINPNKTNIQLLEEYEICTNSNGAIVNIGKDDGIVDGTSPVFKYGIVSSKNDIVNLYDGDFSNIDTTLIGNIGYNAITYTINFFTDDTTLMSTYTVRFGDELDAPESPTPPEHYTFEGWNEKKGGEYWDKNTGYKVIYGNADYIADYRPIVIKQVLFADDEVSVKEDASFDISQLITFKPADYGSDDTVIWASSNPSMATIDNNGMVKGVSAGQSTITVTLAANTTITASKVITIEHSWDTEYTVDKEATCAEDGSKSIYCRVCGAIKPKSAVSIPAEHKWSEEYIVDKEATCTEDGLKSIHCTVCDAVKPESSITIPSAHMWSDDYTIDKEATCTEDGSKSIHCMVCDSVKKDSVVSIPASHEWASEYTTDKEATCTEDGSKSIHCIVCDAVRPESSITIPSTHVWSDDYTIDKEATCTEDGTKSIHCTVCGSTKSGSSISIPAAHTWKVDYTVDVKPTCIENGSESIHCSVCGAVKPGSSRDIEASGHHMTVYEEHSPTCTKAGNEEYFYCDGCRRYYRDENGVEEITLSDVRRAPYGHKLNKIEAKPATCNSNGNDEYYYCSRCKCYFEDEDGIVETTLEAVTIPIDKSIHKWDMGEQTTAATCVEKGVITYTCEVCKETKTEEIPATGQHSWNAGTITTKPTTSATGVKTFTCTVCGETKTESIAKLPPAAPPADPVLGNVTTLDSKAKALPENGDPAGSMFSILQVKGKKVKKTSITIAWKTVPKATGYVVYGAPCGSKYVKLKDIKVTSFTQSGLTKGKYYKYFVSAHDKNGNIIASSKTIHIATSGGKKGNTKSVKLNKKKATLKKGKTVKLRATLKNGKLKASKHRKVAYESDNPRVATVSKSGKVKAVGKGKCTIYAYAQNGVFAKCKITVK